MSKIWFTSDWHLGHTNIAGPSVSNWKDGYRNFNSVHEMNKIITDNINEQVEWDDVIYFLGDFCFGGHQNTPVYRNLIKCGNIHLCRGNHDGHIDKYSGNFSSIQDVLNLSFNNGIRIFCSHYAHRVWHHNNKGIIHLYGHSHSTIERYEWGKSMDVGIDNAYRLFGEYRMFSLEEILNIMNKRDVKIVDHHLDR